jgi:predicted restriction endonuclease
MEISKQSAGGKATAIISRKLAIDKYYSNPKKCLNCGEVIHPKEKQKMREVRNKKFCNHSCSASFNNLKRFVIIEKIFNHIINTKNSIKYRKAKKDKSEKLKVPKFEYLNDKTKGELFENTKWQNARSTIQKHARFIYNNSDKCKCCNVCKYDKHYQVAHKKSVSSFQKEARILDINDIDNLIALCPNHHWEFDHEFLEITL